MPVLRLLSRAGVECLIEFATTMYGKICSDDATVLMNAAARPLLVGDAARPGPKLKACATALSCLHTASGLAATR
jgi:hypothetical protein